MTPEREQLIRQTWDRVAREALEEFRRYPMWRVVLPQKLPDVVGGDVPAERDLGEMGLTFVHEVNRDGSLSWRVVCEGVVVHGPERAT